jgi:hypothetical protein
MTSHRRGIALLCGVLTCVLSWAVAPAAGAVAGERERPVKAAAEASAPARVVAETVTAEKAGATVQEETAGCRRLPRGPARVKLNLKPETDIVDLVAWISSITCRQFLLPGTVLATPRKITVYAPQLITPDGAYLLFLSALDSVGLTVQESGRFFRIIETSKAKSSDLPLYGFAGQLLPRTANRPTHATPETPAH